MERSWKKRRRQPAGASAGLNKGELIEPLNFVAYAELLVEMNQVGAASQQDVLAIVHHLAGSRMLIRGRPAPNIRTALK